MVGEADNEDASITGMGSVHDRGGCEVGGRWACEKQGTSSERADATGQSEGHEGSSAGGPEHEARSKAGVVDCRRGGLGCRRAVER